MGGTAISNSPLSFCESQHNLAPDGRNLETQTVAAILPDPAHAVHIRSEQIHALYRQLPMALASSMVVPVIMAAILWDDQARRAILWWVLATWVVVAVRALLWRAYRRATYVPGWHRRWGVYYLAGALVSGCVWGASGVLLFSPKPTEPMLLLMMVLAGMSASSVIIYAAYLPAFFTYFLPTILPFNAMLLIAGGQALMAGTVLFFVAVLSYYARSYNIMYKQALHLQFENTGLIDELTAQKEQAENANIAKSRFLAAASHDLRQPLHALGLFVSALRKKIHKPETHEIVSNIDASVEALQGLFNALLDISRLDAGVIQPQVTNVAVQGLFDRLARDFGMVAAAKGLTLRFVATQAAVRTDGVLLGRIMHNLVSNALHYTTSGGVVVGCRRREGRLSIEVCDSGVGIVAAERKKVFQEFYQIGNPERDRNKGLGLGLAIVQSLAKLLELPLEMQSVPDRGSRFGVSVPRVASSAVQVTENSAPLVERLRGTLIVVVDDELTIRDGMQALLMDWGCECVLASSGEDALAQLAARARAPDAILADYRLRGGHTGVEAIVAVQAAWGPAIPAIIVTGDTAPERLREAQASGYRLLHKPVPPARLRAVLAHLLE